MSPLQQRNVASLSRPAAFLQCYLLLQFCSTLGK